MKIVLLGKSGCGKTCIVSRYIKETFEDNTHKTNGLSISSKIIIIGDRSITLDIWDTAGDEKFHALVNIFYKDANAIVLVYDITNKYYFEDLKNYWSSKLKESVPKEASKKKIKLYKYLN